MYIQALSIKFLNDVTVELTFRDGKIIRYDMSKMFSKYPQLEELRKNRRLFESGYLDSLGSGIIWNDQLDFSVIGIYECGEIVGQEEISINQQIGVLLLQTRIEKGISQQELARLSHIDQGDISKIEKGIGNPTIAKINKLFKALGKSISIKTQ